MNESKPQPTLSVANFLVGKAHHEGSIITPLKVLKLVYLAHGWHLGLYEKPLIGESAQAWRYGPVIPSVYEDFRHYGHSTIERQKVVPCGGNLMIPTVTDEKVRTFLSRVWDAYKHFDGLHLSTLAHAEGTPWDITWKRYGGGDFLGHPIANSLLVDHYSRMAQ